MFTLNGRDWRRRGIARLVYVGLRESFRNPFFFRAARLHATQHAAAAAIRPIDDGSIRSLSTSITVYLLIGDGQRVESK